jgi:hypothetical protein
MKSAIEAGSILEVLFPLRLLARRLGGGDFNKEVQSDVQQSQYGDGFPG